MGAKRWGRTGRALSGRAMAIVNIHDNCQRMRKGDGVRQRWKRERGKEWEETGKDMEEEKKEQEVRGGL